MLDSAIADNDSDAHIGPLIKKLSSIVQRDNNSQILECRM